VVGLFGLTAGTTGASERGLRRENIRDYGVVYLHPGHHASYYPGAKPIHLKLIFSRDGGRVLGAQAVGEEGVDKRIDVIATTIQLGGTVHDLAEAELGYAPQYGAAKDPVNVAGMLAQNVLRGDMPLADWKEVGSTPALLLDVREADEFAKGHLEGAQNLPLSQLRKRVDELPHDREVWVYCAVGQRAYFAQRLLRQRGIDAKNLSGGYATWLALASAAPPRGS
jgi:rhodanese-related sulfurtransferase